MSSYELILMQEETLLKEDNVLINMRGLTLAELWRETSEVPLSK